MTVKNGQVKVSVSNNGVRSVSPADILRSEKGQQQIRKTAGIVSTTPVKPSGGAKPAK